MQETAASLFSVSLQLFALMTPPAVLSAFISGTAGLTAREKRRVACKTSLAAFLIGLVLYLFGARIFSLFGFTLDAFRIGAGVLLFLSAVSLMRDDSAAGKHRTEDEDISIVPLAIPLCMGPASIGMVMVMGASSKTLEETACGALSLFLAAFGIFSLLWVADSAGKLLRHTGLAVMAKLTGLLLAAIAAQQIFTGIHSFMG